MKLRATITCKECVRMGERLCSKPSGKCSVERNRLRKNSSYSRNKFRIKESNDLDTVELAEIDLAVLPLVGIDINGFRLGYGGGYYDRFFNQESELSRKPFIIGAGYAFQILEVSFAEDHDLKCDSVITEKGVLKF